MSSPPSVGHPVHYVAYGTPGGEYQSVCRHAVVAEYDYTQEETDFAALVVFNPTGLFFNTVRYDGGKAPGTWHYPCARVRRRDEGDRTVAMEDIDSLTGVVQPDGSTITAEENPE